MDKRNNEPSIVLGTLAGYAVAAVVGISISISLSIYTGRASAEADMKILLGLGSIGAYLG